MGFPVTLTASVPSLSWALRAPVPAILILCLLDYFGTRSVEQAVLEFTEISLPLPLECPHSLTNSFLLTC